MGRALLFLVGGMFIILGIVQTGVQGRLSIIPERTYNLHAELHAENAVNSAMDYALREIIINQNWNDGYSSNNYMDAVVNVELYDQTSSNIPVNEISSWDSYTLLVHGTAVYEGILARAEIYLRKDSFSRYSYFTDSEISPGGQNVFFIWSDVLSGPVHTNGRFNIAGDPTFNGFVSSPEMWNGWSGTTNDPNFDGGSDFNAETRDPPSSLELSTLKNSASANGLTLNTDVELEFLPGEEVRIRETDSGTEYTISLTPYNGVISSDSKISLKGTVDGQYTVHSTENIEIIGDIVYNDNPIDNPDSSDLLGIVSEKNVIINKDAHQANGSKDLNIHASIMALNESFSLEDFNSGSPKGALNLLGGIIQMKRGPMGTFSGGSIKSGFSKQYEYDERLMRMNPPSFPRESFFSVVHWYTEVFSESFYTQQADNN
jgi:hypothetical protein